MSRSSSCNSFHICRYGFFKCSSCVAAGFLAVAAPVVLEEIEAPLGELPGILRLVAVAALVARTGPGTRRDVDAGLQALGVDVVHHGLHVRETLVGQQRPSASRVAPPTSGSSS